MLALSSPLPSRIASKLAPTKAARLPDVDANHQPDSFDLPPCIGVSIRTLDQAAAIARLSDVVAGSALIDRIVKTDSSRAGRK